jgi:hypothetical protein
MPALVTNNASATLASGITSSATTITLGTGQGAAFPAASGTSVFWATIINSSNQLEIVKVTAISGDTLTVVRGQDSSTARAYSTGDKLELRPTAALFNAKLDADTAASTYLSQANASTTYGTIANLALKAPIDSPTFTGDPKAPTPTAGDNDTSIATTAFVANAVANSMPTGTRLAFQQTAAPTGWTKDTTAGLNDSVMRIVTGTVGSGGSNAFSTYNAQTATSAYTLATADIPNHTHTYDRAIVSTTNSLANWSNKSGGSNAGTNWDNNVTNTSTGGTGGGGSHTHGLTINIKYYDFIIATKN